MEFRDQLDRVVNIPIIPSRIISLVPSQTELLVDLGLREKIVGITKFCSHPHDLRNEKTVVGGTKNVNFDKISDLKPDFILCNKEENSLEMVEKLQTIAPVWITDMYNMEHCKDMILRIGEVFRNEVAKKIVSDIEVVEKDFQLFMKNKNPKSILYLIWKNPYMAAGRSTFINELLQLNKFENAIVDESSRYPEINLEHFPDVDTILLSSEPYPFVDKHAQDLRKELNKEVIVVDGEFFSWYGSRLLKAFDYFKTLH